ncbi:DUF177 domain-containing protein [Sphingomonas jatrophae]|uniref:Uncharacterized ACR, COG1399 n=1 Tax=Sphingomonas jatrophae TaxID=1166337 RepID=A0A1I6LPI5_9SPHN|nr:DUF177 domain-containing protein [Sphingomonas jatrophae]SFS05343.1 Uncharacterized ACR, COG1399 [Sphingomonas jatrophae]
MTPEFSRPVRLDTLGDAPRTIAIEANEAERTALAARFGLIALEALTAEAAVSRMGETVRATGRVQARLVQACIASGEPLPAEIDEPFDLRFVPEVEAAPDAEIELDEAALDEIPYANGAVDLGEAAAETLGLSIDPFPRGPNAEAALREAGVQSEADMSPFAKLKGLFGQ